MSVNRNQTSIEGGLYDLVARGAKDVYFTKDEKDAINPFDWRYERYPACLPEIRYTNPLNDVRFGQRVEWEFDLPADVLVEATLVITLPTWLPKEYVLGNETNLTYADGNPSLVYGYVNGIAYFLFESIQIFQDNLLLQEVSGDALYAAGLTKGSWNQAFLTEKLAGVHDGSALSIARNATPQSLELQIPMIGCGWEGDRGLPLCGLRQTVFRLRCKLRPLEQLVETTGTEPCPAPWLHTFTQGGSSFSALSRIEIGQPVITLRTKQLYLTNEVRHELAKMTIEIPYIRYFENDYVLNALDYASFERGSGTALVTRFLDANYTVERIVTFFRSSQNITANRLWNFTNSASPDGQFYNTIELIIAGQPRESPWSSDVWQQTVIDAKQERSSSRTICIIDWSRGWRIEEIAPANREPSSGVNFTTADRPMLNLNLKNVAPNPTLGYRQTAFTSLCESWALYRIRNGSGGLEYAN
jgi:hypothetical protein